MNRLRVLLSFCLVLLGLPVLACADGEETVLSCATFVSRDVVAAGTSAEIAVVVKLSGHWHVNAHKPADPNLIPTTLTLEAPAELKLGEPVFPEPVRQKFEFSEEPLLVYQGQFTVRLPIDAAAAAGAGAVDLKGKLRYQACDNTRCLPPREEPISVALVVGAKGAPSQPAHPEVFGGAPVEKKKASLSADDVPRAAGTTFVDRALRKISEGSYGFAFALIFLVGLGLSLTPCVYPVIPITIAFFGNQSHKRGGKTFTLALVYVLGMALMYSSLGVVAALSGKAFGSALSSPWVLVFLAAVMVALALSMFGLWEIGVPSFLATRLAASPSGHAGALFMGLTVGIVAAPCIGPAILALFTYVAAVGKVTTGLSIFFVFALGLGFPFLILGSLSGAIAKLPRSGEWMIWVRHLFGFLLLGVALYFLRPSLGDALFGYGLIVLGIVGGVFLGFLDRTGRTNPTFRRVRATVGVAMVLVALAGLVFQLQARPAGGAIAWVEYEESAFQAAVGAGKPVLVDFTAEWCIPCKELERYTFANGEVAQAAGRFATFRADGTFDGKPAIEALKSRYEVRGFPTVIFIDSRGTERPDLRVVGFVKPDEFRARLGQVD